MATDKKIDPSEITADRPRRMMHFSWRKHRSCSNASIVVEIDPPRELINDKLKDVSFSTLGT